MSFSLHLHFLRVLHSRIEICHIRHIFFHVDLCVIQLSRATIPRLFFLKYLVISYALTWTLNKASSASIHVASHFVHCIGHLSVTPFCNHGLTGFS